MIEHGLVEKMAVAVLALGACSACCGVGSCEDYLNASPAQGPIVALLEGRRVSCFEEVHQFSGTGPIPNVKSNGSCASSVTTFARDHAVYRQSPLSSFTDGSGDTLQIALSPRKDVALSLWVVDPPLSGAWPGMTAFCASIEGLELCTAIDGLRRAAYSVLRDRGAGVSLVSGLKKAELVSVGGTCATAKDKDLTNNPSVYDKNAINAYFVASGAFSSSWNCGLSPLHDPQVIFVALGSAADTTLLHELGHALSLSHFNGGVLVDKTNVMCTGSTCGDPSNRNELGLGQLFRANLNSHSALKLLGVNTFQPRCCSDSMEYSPCAVPNLGVPCPDPELSNPLQLQP